MIENPFSYLLNNHIRKLRKTSPFQETKLNITLMSNPKTTPYTKKSTLMNQMSKNKNFNPSSREFKLKLKLLRDKFQFQELLFINKAFFNQSLTEKEQDSRSEMVKKNTTKTLQKFSQLNFLKTLEFKKSMFQDLPSTNNTPLSLN